MLYLLSSPVLSDRLIRSLETAYVPPAHAKGDVIVWLGGGATLDTPNLSGKGNLSGAAANRLLTSMQLYQKLHVPIIVSGGQVFKSSGPEAQIAAMTLEGAGIPKDKIIVESSSLNTTQNALFTKKLLDRYGFRQPILVTSAFHMNRAVKQFVKAGVAVIPYPADYHVNLIEQLEPISFVPSADALGSSSLAIKEYLGLLVSQWY